MALYQMRYTSQLFMTVNAQSSTKYSQKLAFSTSIIRISGIFFIASYFLSYNKRWFYEHIMSIKFTWRHLHNGIEKCLLPYLSVLESTMAVDFVRLKVLKEVLLNIQIFLDVTQHLRLPDTHGEGTIAIKHFETSATTYHLIMYNIPERLQHSL